MTAAVLALTSPGRIVPLARTTEGIDLVLVMDLSSSMLAQDLDAARTRLDVAKDAAREFVARRSSDRIGLVTYARYPDLRCPLTLDHAALETMIRELSPVASDGPEDATGIGAALAMAVRALRAAESTSRVVVLLSDGAENVAQADAPREITPDRAAALAREWEVRVMTIVVGKGTLDAERNLVPLDTTALRKAAETTQGRFYEATDAEALREIYAHIDGLEKAPLTEARFRVEAWTFGFVLAALLAFGGAQLLAATVWRTWP
jgi:Ca-activated chloride channel family protein